MQRVCLSRVGSIKPLACSAVLLAIALAASAAEGEGEATGIENLFHDEIQNFPASGTDAGDSLHILALSGYLKNETAYLLA